MLQTLAERKRQPQLKALDVYKFNDHMLLDGGPTRLSGSVLVGVWILRTMN